MSDRAKAKLETCPFCGSEARLWKVECQPCWMVECSAKSCWATGPIGVRNEAIEKWNTRVEVVKLEEEI